MSFDLARIMQSKRAFRQQLAAKPIEEKLAMLDALRARTIALRGSRQNLNRVRSKGHPPAYGTRAKPPE